MIAARPDPRWIGREFLAHVWTLDVVRRQIEAGARTTNGTHKVNQGTIAAIEVPVPPLEGQAQFADAVKAVACAAVAQEVSRMHFDDLFASLQQRAFRGEL